MKINREVGLREIDEAKWIKDDFDVLNLVVHDENGRDVHCYLSLRPVYCDRGHIQLNIDGSMDLNIDNADMFPRFFMSQVEAKRHCKEFLKWRLWKERVHPHILTGD